MRRCSGDGCGADDESTPDGYSRRSPGPGYGGYGGHICGSSGEHVNGGYGGHVNSSPDRQLRHGFRLGQGLFAPHSPRSSVFSFERSPRGWPFGRRETGPGRMHATVTDYSSVYAGGSTEVAYERRKPQRRMGLFRYRPDSPGSYMGGSGTPLVHKLARHVPGPPRPRVCHGAGRTDVASASSAPAARAENMAAGPCARVWLPCMATVASRSTCMSKVTRTAADG